MNKYLRWHDQITRSLLRRWLGHIEVIFEGSSCLSRKKLSRLNLVADSVTFRFGLLAGNQRAQAYLRERAGHAELPPALAPNV